jgi:F-type H+-transporting ATPase subunit delta
MKNRLIAKRYADALLMNIDEKHFASFRQDINKLELSFAKNTDYVKSINSPLYPLQERFALAQDISQKLANKALWGNLFKILVKKHRFNIIDDVLLELDDAILQKDNLIKVQLTIAHEHPKKVLEDISKAIKNILKKDIELTVQIDPAIIGGFVAQTESLQIDGSIKNNLLKLTNVKKKNMRSV